MNFHIYLYINILLLKNMKIHTIFLYNIKHNIYYYTIIISKHKRNII